ncbi:cell cycle control protein cwf22-related [Holotrichia oblita]|uniref:Cell cycle control protein cwf22-related n=1 Tax=Holotrichia oblita TaxID=644536 RepID=A0ACB9SN05_HOLOL|nr:cell cycle control protein cwf22-related [Holotrichia oblita]
MVNIKRHKKQGKTNRPKTRKELRKEERKLKKQRRQEYYTNRRKPGQFVLKPPDDENIKDVKENDKDLKQIPKKKVKNVSAKPAGFNDIENEKMKQKKLEKEMQKQRSKQLLEANLEEDRNIKRLEKQLKLNKRKSKSIPKTFASEGLDYILEVCDSENMKGIVNAEQEINDSGSEFGEDFALMTNQPLKDARSNEQDEEQSTRDSDENNENFSGDSDDDLDENHEFQNESSESEASDIDMSDDERSRKNKRKIEDETSSLKKQKIMSEDSGSSESEIEEEKVDDNVGTDKMDTWEDIYGRLRAKDGAVISDNSNKYIPPAIRAKMESDCSEDKKRIEKLNRLKKQIKGLLNRLAEANMHSISTQIEELYMNNSRNDMNDTITNLMLESLTSMVNTPERLLIEHVLLITILHANVGTEVGAHFLHAVVKQFNKLFDSEQVVENKSLDNTINVIAQLYNFKIFNSKLVYELLSKLSRRFDEKCIECILLVLKSVGFSLRKDDPLALKGLIIELQKQAANVSEETKENSRIKYMLDILLAIKNNNMSKIPNYDTSYSEHLKKLQKNFIRKGNYVTQLNISLEDLLKADERGRWWIVGSAWSGVKEEAAVDKSNLIKTESNEYSQKLLDLARKQRMNTDTRRSIFCIIMSAEDYLDAFEKLLRLGLKNQQEREIIHVILHCCLQEKQFNPYYAILTQKFCEYDRKFQMIIKYSIWDKVKTLSDCSASQISNLAKLLTHLFLEKGLSISTLKVVEFGELDKITLRFIRQILLGILLCEETDSCVAVFEKVAQSDKLKMFKESLRLFIHHFLLKNLKTDKVPEENKNLLKVRSEIIEKMLTIRDKRSKF